MTSDFKIKKLRHSSKQAGHHNLDELNEIKERCRYDLKYFVEYFFPHHFWGEMSEMHRAFCEVDKDKQRRGLKEAIAAPRGNAKTTFKVLIDPIHDIVYGFERFILIIGYSDTEAIDKVKDIRNELLSNENLRAVYGKLVSPKCGMGDFVTSNNVRVVARSRGGQVRGLKHGADRPSKIISDDIESLISVNTPEQRDKTKQWFFKDVIGCGRADGQSNFTLVGTIIHEESLLADLLKKPGWRHKKYQAIKSWASNTDLWNEWERLYCNLDDPDREETAQQFYNDNQPAMDEGVKVLWPDGEPYYKLMEYKVQNGLASLHSEKQNDPFDPERQILNPDLCPRFKVYWPSDAEWIPELGEDGFAIVRQDTGAAISSRDLNIIAFLDPALGKKPTSTSGTNSDYAAIVVCAQDLSGYIYVLDVWLKRKPPNEQIKQTFAMHKKWGFDTLFLETVGFQELMKPLFIEEQKLWANQMRIVGVGQHNNKHARISTLEPYFTNRWILLPMSIDHEFYNQLKLFPTVHDDGPDALHGCVSRLRKPAGGIRTHGTSSEVI